MCVCARVDLSCIFFSLLCEEPCFLFVPSRFSAIWHFTVVPTFFFDG